MRAGEQGAAIVMALVAASLFAYAALLILQAERSGAVVVEARASRVRLAAAADAGLAIAAHAFAQADPAARWPADGRPRRIKFDGVALTVTLTGERSKLPVNQVPVEVWGRLLAAAGAGVGEVDALADAIADWIDGDTAPRPHGAERDAYRALGGALLPRNEAIHSLGELAEVRGMRPDLLARIAPALTLYPGGRFDPAQALPLARQAMATGAADSEADALGRTTRAAWADDDPVDLRGRAVTLQVEAEDGTGARLERRAIVELTGAAARPLWVREYR